MSNIHSSVMTVEGETFITVVVPGLPPLVCNSQHPNYEAIQDLVAGRMGSPSMDAIESLFDVGTAVSRVIEQQDRSVSKRLRISGGTVLFDIDGDGHYEPVHNALTGQIVKFFREGVDDWKPLVRFFERLANNPSDH